MKKNMVLGVGAALVDLLIEESDSFVQKWADAKGGMSLVDNAKLQQILQDSKASSKTVPGGSACNTLVGLSKLGGAARFIGTCGEDKWADLFSDGLTKAAVETRLAKSATPTGRVLSVVTPDAQRTMFTCLGAAAEVAPTQLNATDFAEASWVHLEGYLLYNRPVVDRILELAKEHKVKVSLDLASFQVVEHLRVYIEEVLAKGVDLLIANEDEAAAYTLEKDELKGLEILRKKSELVVYKLGKRGARIADKNGIVEITAKVVKAIDTTGAGDLWAAGFLYGLTEGWSLEKSGNAGSIVASEVVQVMGASISDEGWGRIKAAV